MVRFMIATFTDLILRVGIAAVLSATALGSTGIWMAWLCWCIGTALSMVFYVTAIRKALAEPGGCCRGRGTGRRSPRRGRICRRRRDGDPVTFLQHVNLFHVTDKQNEQFEIVHKITL